jgi:hypothetical protein
VTLGQPLRQRLRLRRNLSPLLPAGGGWGG